MLQRIEITGFVIDNSVSPPAVVTQFRINDIPTTSTGAGSGVSIQNAISNANFNVDVLSHTVAAIANQTTADWTSPGSVFPTAPTDD